MDTKIERKRETEKQREREQKKKGSVFTENFVRFRLATKLASFSLRPLLLLLPFLLPSSSSLCLSLPQLMYVVVKYTCIVSVYNFLQLWQEGKWAQLAGWLAFARQLIFCCCCCKEGSRCRYRIPRSQCVCTSVSPYASLWHQTDFFSSGREGLALVGVYFYLSTIAGAVSRLPMPANQLFPSSTGASRASHHGAHHSILVSFANWKWMERRKEGSPWGSSFFFLLSFSLNLKFSLSYQYYYYLYIHIYQSCSISCLEVTCNLFRVEIYLYYIQCTQQAYYILASSQFDCQRVSFFLVRWTYRQTDGRTDRPIRRAIVGSFARCEKRNWPRNCVSERSPFGLCKKEVDFDCFKGGVGSLCTALRCVGTAVSAIRFPLRTLT